jgi:hypothetical protein
VITPTTSAVYNLQGNDGPCAATASVPVYVLAAPLLTVVSSADTICYGKTAVLNVAGPYSQFSWMPGNGSGATLFASPVSSTNYTVYGTGGPGGCGTSTTVHVAVVQAPTSLISTLNPPCDDACSGIVDAVVSGGIAPYTFSVSGQPCNSLPCTNLCPALYTLYTTDAKGCVAVNYFSIDCYQLEGVSQLSRPGGYKVFPNPTRDLLTIEVQGKFSYTLYSDLGQLLGQKRECVNRTEIDLSHFVQGIYLLEIRQDEEVTYRKVVRE